MSKAVSSLTIRTKSALRCAVHSPSLVPFSRQRSVMPTCLIHRFSSKKNLNKTKVMKDWKKDWDTSPVDKDFEVIVPERKLSFRYALSGGPGGQNVNKIASKCELRFTIEEAVSDGWLPETVKDRLIQKHGSRVNKEGEFVMTCDTHRTQHDNKNSVIQRFKDMIEECCYPEKERKETGGMPDEMKEYLRSKERDFKSKQKQRNFRKNNSI